MITHSCAEGEVTTETHASGANPACACWQAQEVVDGLVRVLVIGLESLLGTVILAHPRVSTYIGCERCLGYRPFSPSIHCPGPSRVHRTPRALGR